MLARFEGDVQLVLYPFTLNPASEVATQAALCAGEQGKFWEFHPHAVCAPGAVAAPSRSAPTHRGVCC